MRDVLALFRARTAFQALESAATLAGCAMACPFGSSAELEAALIREKLAAGAYGRKRRWRYILTAAAAGSLLTALLWMF